MERVSILINRSKNLESIIIEINSKKALLCYIFLDIFCLGFSPKTETENVQNITYLTVEISSGVYSIVTAAFCRFTTMKTLVCLKPDIP